MKDTNKMTYEININNNTYKVIITKKKIKRIIIKINHKTEILVSSPMNLSYSDALNKVFLNTKWIEKTLNKYKDINQEFDLDLYYEKKIIYIQGNRYKLIPNKDLTESFIFIDDIIYCKNSLDSSFNKIIDSYLYLIEAEFARVYNSFKKDIKQKPILSIRKMKSRWGSCNYNTGKIVINKMLVSVPPELLSYVMIHEFCHLIYPNHSRDYYNLLGRILKNYKILEKELKKYAFLLNK